MNTLSEQHKKLLLLEMDLYRIIYPFANYYIKINLKFISDTQIANCPNLMKATYNGNKLIYLLLHI